MRLSNFKNIWKKFLKNFDINLIKFKIIVRKYKKFWAIFKKSKYFLYKV